MVRLRFRRLSEVLSQGSGQGDLAKPVKPEPLQLWSPGLASGDQVRGSWERGGEKGDPGELGSDTFSLTLCSPPSVPPEATTSCHGAPGDSALVLPGHWPLLPFAALEGGLGTR